MRSTLKAHHSLTVALALVSSFAFAPPICAQKQQAIPVPRTTTPRAPQLGGKQADIPVALAVAVQQSKLIASDAATNDFFGTSVAISGDTAVIGASGDAEPGNDSGSAYVFIRTGTTWTMQQKLTASDAAENDFLGTSVAISGNTVVVGSPADDSPNIDAGSAYVFVRTGTTWAQQQKLTASDQMPFDRFGESVAINGDTVMAGAEQSNSPVANTGAVYVFTRTGTIWTQQQKLTASDAATEDRFGISLAISGETAIIGAYGDDGFTGSAYVFVRTGATWAQQQKLVASDRATNDWFGKAVAIDGNTVVVGALRIRRFGAPTIDGAAYVFVRTGTNWTQQQQLINPEPSFDELDPDFYSNGVAVSGDTIVVGASADVEDLIIGPGTDSGSAYVFIRSGTTWTMHQKLVGAPGVSTGEGFGFSAAISSGGAIIIGANADDRILANAGSAYVYISPQVAPTLPGQLIISEFRARGPNGDGDDFVELYNNTDSAITVDPADKSSGFALVASDGVTRFVIPTGTVIPARGHFLAGGFHSLIAYAANDANLSANIPVNVGIAFFNTSIPANFTLANRLDAVGSSSEANPLYREGAGYAPVNIVDTQYSLLRDLSAARPKDTQNNQADFRVVGPTMIVRADGTYGYPGPENLGSPIERTRRFPSRCSTRRNLPPQSRTAYAISRPARRAARSARSRFAER